VKRATLILALTASILALTASFVRAESLQDVLRRMDQAAQTFKSLSADVHKTDYTAVFDETTQEDGNFKMMKRAKTGVVLLATFTGRDPRTLRVAGNKVEYFHPKANSVDEYDARKYTKSVDSILLVGFGVSSANLQKDYDIAVGGSETINGKKTTRLDLTPKSAERKKIFNMIQLWIPEDSGNPIQEKRLLGKENKDYNLLQFSNVKINPPLPESDFELNLPKDVKRIVAGK
jgi:outer membrane lipoprotein-sorting protein